jgi:hypothetical protein
MEASQLNGVGEFASDITDGSNTLYFNDFAER